MFSLLNLNLKAAWIFLRSCREDILTVEPVEAVAEATESLSKEEAVIGNVGHISKLSE